MLKTARAIRFDRAVASGRTKPAVFTCEVEDSGEIELVVKFAVGCDMKERALAAEGIAAMLPADLDLPVPDPFVVELETGLASIIPDSAIRQRSAGKDWPAFGPPFGDRRKIRGRPVFVLPATLGSIQKVG